MNWAEGIGQQRQLIEADRDGIIHVGRAVVGVVEAVAAFEQHIPFIKLEAVAGRDRIDAETAVPLHEGDAAQLEAAPVAIVIDRRLDRLQPDRLCCGQCSRTLGTLRPVESLGPVQLPQAAHHLAA